MHVLALVNQKGGCGKTTTAVNLAAALAERGDKVVLVDLDPQAHATLALGWAIEREPTVLDVLRERVTLHEAMLPVAGGFRLVPATARLAEFEEIAERMLQPERALARAVQASRLHAEWAVLDCPPRADGVLARNALRACDTALLVVECGAFALQGALKALDVLEDVAEQEDSPFEVRAVATMFDRRLRIGRELLIGMQNQLGPILFDTAIASSVRLREAAAAGVPVTLLDRESRAAQDFRALAEEVDRLRARPIPPQRAQTKHARPATSPAGNLTAEKAGA